MSKNVLSVLLMAGTLAAFAGPGAAEDGYPVAGTEPSKRPLGAPVIEKVQKDAGWYEKALTGVSEPYPRSLRFLEDQGNWYTPFTRPGMTGRYDIRGWHD